MPKAPRLFDESKAFTPAACLTADMNEEVEEMEEEEEEEEGCPTPTGQLKAPKGNGKRRAVRVLNDDLGEEKQEEGRGEEEEDAEEVNIDARLGIMGAVPRQKRDRLDRARVTQLSDQDKTGSPAEEYEETPPPKRRKGRRRSTLSDKSEEEEAGIVLKVHLSNFMCHRKLTIRFCKQVNFINGSNGSGKSAVLAALQICLGAKVNLTHRAKKMTDFIRHGWAGDAILEVTLLNNKYGFKYEQYGDSITIRRTIKQPSGGGFTIHGHNGTLVSKDRAELVRMLDILNIQVENPCAVLDQENAKRFLQGNGKEKYAFFMKATELQRILDEIDATSRTISQMKAGYEEGKAVNPSLKNIIRQKREELKDYDILDGLERKIAHLNEELAWAFVQDLEESVANATEKIERELKESDTINERICKLEEEGSAMKAEEKRIKERLDAGVAEVQSLKKVVIEKGNEFLQAKEPLQELRAQRTLLVGEKKTKMAAKSAASRKVMDAREVAKRRASDQREKDLLEGIQRTERRLADVGHMRGQMGGDEKIFRLRQVMNSAGEDAERTEEDFQSSNKDLVALKAKLRSLQTQSFNPLTAISPHMPDLVKLIVQEARRFRTPPVGPIGASIQLKEGCDHFRVCIEGHLSGNLSSFVVSCQRDKTVLMALMKRFRGGHHWPLPTVIVQAPQPRYRPPENPPGYLQIMQAINVTDDQVFNSLVDQCSIEKNCLFTSKAEAESQCLVGASGRYQRMPHGMYEAYYPSLGGKSCSKFNVSDGNVQTRMNTVNANRHRSVLGVDERTQKQEIEMQVRQAMVASQQLRAVADAGARSLNAAKASLRQEELQRTNLEKEERLLEKEKNRLSTELMALQAKKNDSTNPMEELERELEVATEELDDVTTELATMASSIQQAMAQVEPFRQSKGAAERAHKEAKDSAEKIREEFDKVGIGGAMKVHQAFKSRLALDKVAENLAAERSRVGRLKAYLASVVKKAKTVTKNTRAAYGEEWDGSRVYTEQTVEEIVEKAKASKARYETEYKKRKISSRSRAEVEDQLANAIATSRETTASCDKLLENVDILLAEKEKRVIMWDALKHFVAQQTNQMFNEFFQDRGAAGEVTFDFKNQHLGLTYQKSNKDYSNRCSDIKLLSGGERSTATLALLLAMGKRVETPFRVMDEFDVFMDAEGRDAAIKTLVNFAKLHRGMQFIFITPQDLPSVIASDSCKIIKMKAPRKEDHNQWTLEEAFGGGDS